METLTTNGMEKVNGGWMIDLNYFDRLFPEPPDGPVYADGTGSGHPGEIWFP